MPVNSLIVGWFDGWIERSKFRNKKLPNYPTTQLPNYQKGFTLIEFLVVMGILALVVGSTTIFMSSILKGTNQANAIGEVKQNGQAALDSVERQIRGAVDAQAFGPDHIMIVRRDGDPLQIRCLPRAVDEFGKYTINDHIATAVAADKDYPTVNYVTLSNDDPETGVNIDTSSCKFTVTKADASGPRIAPAVVTLKFTATQGLNAARRVDFAASAEFKTTISLRTYE